MGVNRAKCPGDVCKQNPLVKQGLLASNWMSATPRDESVKWFLGTCHREAREKKTPGFDSDLAPHLSGHGIVDPGIAWCSLPLTSERFGAHSEGYIFLPSRLRITQCK